MSFHLNCVEVGGGLVLLTPHPFLFVLASDQDCTQWTQWSDCTVLCTGGDRYRARACVEGASLNYQSENETCLAAACEGACSAWSSWSTCTQSCGPDAQRLRVRPCIKYLNDVAQQEIETHESLCVDIPCKYTFSILKCI